MSRRVVFANGVSRYESEDRGQPLWESLLRHQLQSCNPVSIKKMTLKPAWILGFMRLVVCPYLPYISLLYTGFSALAVQSRKHCTKENPLKGRGAFGECFTGFEAQFASVADSVEEAMDVEITASYPVPYSLTSPHAQNEHGATFHSEAYVVSRVSCTQGKGNRVLCMLAHETLLCRENDSERWRGLSQSNIQVFAWNE